MKNLNTLTRKMAAFAIFTFAFCFLVCGFAQASSITVGPALTNLTITSENPSSLFNGTTVQVTVDVDGQVEVDFYQVSGSSFTQVASIIRSVTGGVPQSIFWNGLWLIGSELG